MIALLTPECAASRHSVPDREGRVHFKNATLSKSLAPIAENLALHFALLGGRLAEGAG